MPKRKLEHLSRKKFLANYLDTVAVSTAVHKVHADESATITVESTAVESVPVVTGVSVAVF
jgi:hypothetical protein